MGCTFGISQAFVTATAMLAIADVLWADATFATTDVHSNWNITRTFIQPRFSMWLAMKLKQPFEMPTFLCDIFHFLSFNFCRKTYMPSSTKSNVLWEDPPSTWLLNPSRASNIGSATFHRTYLFLPKSPVQLGIANIWKLKKCENWEWKKLANESYWIALPLYSSHKCSALQNYEHCGQTKSGSWDQNLPDNEILLKVQVIFQFNSVMKI